MLRSFIITGRKNNLSLCPLHTHKAYTFLLTTSFLGNTSVLFVAFLHSHNIPLVHSHSIRSPFTQLQCFTTRHALLFKIPLQHYFLSFFPTSTHYYKCYTTSFHIFKHPSTSSNIIILSASQQKSKQASATATSTFEILWYQLC